MIPCAATHFIQWSVATVNFERKYRCRRTDSCADSFIFISIGFSNHVLETRLVWQTAITPVATYKSLLQPCQLVSNNTKVSYFWQEFWEGCCKYKCQLALFGCQFFFLTMLLFRFALTKNKRFWILPCFSGKHENEDNVFDREHICGCSSLTFSILLISKSWR